MISPFAKETPPLGSKKMSNPIVPTLSRLRDAKRREKLLLPEPRPFRRLAAFRYKPAPVECKAQMPRLRATLLVLSVVLEVARLPYTSAQIEVPCPNGCSGNGVCDRFVVCHCNKGYFGYDCSLQYCPVGKSWGIVKGVDDAHGIEECSGRGTCIYATGSCACQQGFTGDACQYSECPESCSEHGKCVSMQTLAENEVKAREYHDRGVFVYDSIWDFDAIHGCECDNGYQGTTCALKTCSLGDDPLTTGQTNEVQLLQCLTTYQQQRIVLRSDEPLTRGTFLLRFGKQYTRPISYAALADLDSYGVSVASSLLALSGITDVAVTRTDASATQIEWHVTFPASNTVQGAVVPRWKTVEVQQFICAADEGVFAVFFGNETVRDIPYNADANTLISFLSGFSFFGDIGVELTNSDGGTAVTVCTPTGTFVTLTFTHLWHRELLEDLPPMTFSTLDLKDVVVLLLNGGDGFLDTETKEVVKGLDSCRVPEEQQILCAATSGTFTLTFEDGTTLPSLPFSISAETLKDTIESNVPYITDVDVVFDTEQTSFCSDLGTTTTIRFVVVKIMGAKGDGDLAEITADQTNGGTNGLVHISNRLKFATSFTEVVKGAACEPLDQTFSADPSRQMQAPVVAGGGFFTVAFRGTTSRPIEAHATPERLKQVLEELPSIQGVDVSYSGAQACETPANLARITFTQNFGNLPTIVVDDALMTAGSSVTVAGGGMELDGVLSVDGTKESEDCSGRGFCDETLLGRCYCFTGYTNSDGNGEIGNLQVNRGDCGALSRIPVACPGDLPCSGHGTCSGDPSYRCTCSEGWRLGDCSERTCPFGLSWFSYPSNDNVAHQIRSECSDAGECDRSNGQCKCQPPYTGSACEFMSCGGTDEMECSGKGQCLALLDLAPLVTINGVRGGFSYGEDPNAVETWDAKRVRSCLCDAPYFGYDCSQQECPRGDDFNTYEDVIERQVIQCTATEGSFTLTFREATTTNIPVDATAIDVKTALEELATIGEVDVFLEGGSTVCSVATSVILVDFLTELGDLPSLSGSNALLQDRVGGDAQDGSGTLQFATGGDELLGHASVKGTRENAFCSNHGICDFSTGVCACHPNYGGSDGKGGPGPIANCGFYQLTAADDTEA